MIAKSWWEQGVFDRYEMKPEVAGWTVYDITTGSPASLNGLVLGGLCLEEADDLVDLLNSLHLEQLEATLH